MITNEKESPNEFANHTEDEDQENDATETDYFNESTFSYSVNQNQDFLSPTPPLSSRNGISRSRSRTPLLNKSYRSACQAKTRIGTPCKLSTLPGRDFCHRHLNGDSVMG